MKLYLSSYRLGDNPQELAKLFGDNKKIAVIPNAVDTYQDDEKKKESLQKNIDDLTNIGLIPDILDLKDYFGKTDDLRDRLNQYGGVLVRGGNTFVLRRAFKQSGFDQIIKDLAADFVYAGYSAGGCVLAPTLKGIDIPDDPHIVPNGYNPEVIWEGLGLIDYSFAPHYRSNHPESEAIERAVEYFKARKMPYKALHDGEIIILNSK